MADKRRGNNTTGLRVNTSMTTKRVDNMAKQEIIFKYTKARL
jgi:hypothetical protein